MNIEYRTLKRDGNCNCCYTTIQKDKDLCIIFRQQKEWCLYNSTLSRMY